MSEFYLNFQHKTELKQFSHFEKKEFMNREIVKIDTLDNHKDSSLVKLSSVAMRINKRGNDHLCSLQTKSPCITF